MSDTDRIERRLAAVERALVDGDHALNDLPELASIAEDVDRLDSRLDAVERSVADLEGAIDSLRGYVASVDAVNEDVERRADAAIATVDRLERRLDELGGAMEGPDGGSAPSCAWNDGTRSRQSVGSTGAEAVDEPAAKESGPDGERFTGSAGTRTAAGGRQDATPTGLGRRESSQRDFEDQFSESEATNDADDGGSTGIVEAFRARLS